MENHLHVLARVDAKEANQWSDEEMVPDIRKLADWFDHHLAGDDYRSTPPSSGQAAVARRTRNDRSTLTLSTCREAVTGLDGPGAEGVNVGVNVNAVAAPGARPSPLLARSD